MNDDLMISVITPCLNRADFISNAVESVLNQDYKQVEHIIIDGGSNDGTLEILKQYPHLCVVSEPDNGVYDAINKGIKIATGDIIGLLNTDDFYEYNIFLSVANTFQSNPEIEAIVGGIDILARDQKDKLITKDSFPTIFPDQFWHRITIGSPNTNAWFFHKRIFDRIGNFDITYKYVADRDFLIRCGINHVGYSPIDELVYHYLQHPESLTLDGTNDAEAQFMFEMRSMVESYLTEKEITSEINDYLLKWHSDILSAQLISAIRNNHLSRVYYYGYRGLQWNPKWPIVFLRRLLFGFYRRSSRYFTN